MTEYSGIAGVVPRGQPVEQPAFSGFADKLLAMVEARKRMAFGQIQTMLTLAQSGFPVDDKKWNKLVKISGLPIATKEEDLLAHKFTANKISQQNQPTTPNTPQTAGTKGGGAGAAVSASPQAQKLSWINQMSQNARQKFANDAEKMQRVDQLQKRLMENPKDANAWGGLMAMNEIPLNVDALKWFGMTDDQRSSVFDMAAGHMSEAQKAQLAEQYTTKFMESGRFSNPADAAAAGRAMASGGQIPADLQAKMKPYSFKDLADQATLIDQAINAGVPPDKVGEVVQKASVVGLAAALPPGLKPVALKSLELQQGQLNVEKSRLGIERTRAEAELKFRQEQLERMKGIEAKVDAAEAAKAKSEEDKQFFEEYKTLITAQKGGVKVPKEILDQMNKKFADKVGLKYEEAESYGKWLVLGLGGLLVGRSTSTGPMSFMGGGQFTPKSDDEALKAAGVGKETPAPAPKKGKSTIGSIGEELRKITGESN